MPFPLLAAILGEEVHVVDPRSGQVDLFALPDQVDFEVAEFNKRVYTRAFNRAVADVIARECSPGERGKTLLFAARDDHADILVDELRAALTAEHDYQSLMLPVLRLAAEGEIRVPDVAARLAAELGLALAERDRLLAIGRQTVLRDDPRAGGRHRG